MKQEINKENNERNNMTNNDRTDSGKIMNADNETLVQAQRSADSVHLSCDKGLGRNARAQNWRAAQ